MRKRIPENNPPISPATEANPPRGRPTTKLNVEIDDGSNVIYSDANLIIGK
jgi:hypothetical protein